jgi:hypothetical protein
MCRLQMRSHMLFYDHAAAILLIPILQPNTQVTIDYSTIKEDGALSFVCSLHVSPAPAFQSAAHTRYLPIYTHTLATGPLRQSQPDRLHLRVRGFSQCAFNMFPQATREEEENHEKSSSSFSMPALTFNNKLVFQRSSLLMASY